MSQKVKPKLEIILLTVPARVYPIDTKENCKIGFKSSKLLD